MAELRWLRELVKTQQALLVSKDETIAAFDTRSTIVRDAFTNISRYVSLYQQQIVSHGLKLAVLPKDTPTGPILPVPTSISTGLTTSGKSGFRWVLDNNKKSLSFVCFQFQQTLPFAKEKSMRDLSCDASLLYLLRAQYIVPGVRKQHSRGQNRLRCPSLIWILEKRAMMPPSQR